MSSKKTLFLLLIFLAFSSRLLFLNWGDSYFFHPDENNMAWALSNLKLNNLNPNFFAYGQFPLFLGFILIQIYHFIFNIKGQSISFFESIIALRLISSFFSILLLYFLYKVGKIINKKDNYIYLLLLIFSPALIQLSHFGTTESILIFILSFSIYFTLSDPKKYTQFSFAGIILALGFSSKISSLIFLIPIFIVYYKKIKHLIILLVSFSFFSFIFSPYNFLDFNSFFATIIYESKIASNKIDVFYTRQFESTLPYIFQFTHIFPYALGLPVLIFSFLSFCKLKITKEIKIVLLFFFIYFLYFGATYVKWYRFISPVFPIFILFASLFISNISNKYFKNILLIVAIIPGLIFFNNNYLIKSTRQKATSWINNNIPQNSYILSEDRNVIPLPLNNYHLYNINEFNFYDLDSDIKLQEDLNKELQRVDYIIIPSRRIYMNHNKDKFPIVAKYYDDLFSDKLNFTKVAEFHNHVSFPLDSNLAEETFSVFDNPKIEIYKRKYE